MAVNLIECFEKTAGQKSKHTAVIHNDESISFGELRRKIRITGAFLQVLIHDKSRPVAVILPKEINIVIADLGVIYSSNVFMNIDVKTPAERLSNILSLIQPAVIITSRKYSLSAAENIPVVFIEDIDFSQEDTESFTFAEGIDTDPLCIINTSGSTGTPKGVVLNHRSFFDFMARSNEEFRFDGSEIIGSLSPAVFDIFDFELCMLMLNGSQIVLIDAFLASFPARLLENLNKHRVSFIFWVPSIMVNIANMNLLEKIPLQYLKLVWFAGEVFPVRQFLYWYDHLSDTEFANLYGPIEITLDCTFYRITSRPPENEPLPIGKPYKNTDILILNENDELCAVNEEGELCVRGTSLAMGYYNNPEKTAQAFTQNPLNKHYPETIYRTGDIVRMREDGNIVFMGRRDTLIKHMGYRIELGEIEHVISNELKIAENCCVVYDNERKAIVLFYEQAEAISDKEFRSALTKHFPAYMIPAKFIRMELLPRNTNGKIDRLQLKNSALKGDY